MASRKLDVVVRPESGGVYETWVDARPRRDGRWAGYLEFRPIGDGVLMRSSEQTSQRTEQQVVSWAEGLSIAHIENAFVALARPAIGGQPGISPLPTPADRHERHEHLRPIERDVLSIFGALRTSKLMTREIFLRGPHANADFVRAFEHLEKEDRLLVRFTKDGIDWLELTPAGASLLGLPQPDRDAIAEPPKPQV
jgi:hypothetical protein